MKIMIFSNSSWSIFNFRLGLIRSLIADGHQIVMLSAHDSYAQFLYKFGTVYTVPLKARGINPFNEIFSIFSIIKVFTLDRPDIVLTFTIKPNIYGSLIARLFNIQVVNNITGLGQGFLYKGVFLFFFKCISKISFAKSKRVFFQNLSDKNFFCNAGIVNENNVDILPGSGVDLTKFSYCAPKPNRKFTFMFVSRILLEKGVLEFVAAARNIRHLYPNSKFFLVGSILHEQGQITSIDILKWVNDGVIEYRGHIDNVKIILAKADCVVLPSFYMEGTPKILLEAAAIGRPLITTNIPGCNDIVKDGVNGYLCKPRDIKTLFKAMERLIKMPLKKRVEMGINSRKIAEAKYDEKIVIKKYKKII